MAKTVLLGVTGGISAYKIPLLVRLLVKDGIDVHVVMTRAATQFVTPMTLATLSENPVHLTMWDNPEQPDVEHISLADSADLAVIAPATANIVGKMASGIADDMLTTALLAVTCPVLLCPSMNVNMYRNPLVQENLEKLKRMAYNVMEPGAGFLACGWTGEGRLPEPEMIFETIRALLATKDLKGERILVTAGPTEEPLDPVRFLTNRSSGRMGVAVARRAFARGADVTLIHGPMKVTPPPGLKSVPVGSALDMQQRVTELFPDTHVVIKAAAVADFRPAFQSGQKIKKDGAESSIELVKNPDILKILGEKKQATQILVGFAAETQDILLNGRAKLKSKNLDMLVLNDVSRPGAGFDHDTNIVRFLHRSGKEEQMSIMSKDQVADLILDRVKKMRSAVKSVTDARDQAN
ncbi:bifunctional phosphopantothenoylcysteine decarboxylase/phosphopantothenate--cysteine ligase CoaBC [Thermodesulfobacteriota bacterium]